MAFCCAVCEKTFHSRNGRRHHMIVDHRVRYDRSGRNVELADEEDVAAVRRNQQHRRRRRRGAVEPQRQMAIPFRAMSHPPNAAEPDAIVISSDEEEDGAAQREDLAQFVSDWVHRWPSRSARLLVAEFVDIGADDWERLRDLIAVGVELERQLAEAILSEATRVVGRRGTVRDIYEVLRSLLLAAVNRPLR